ncbi:MAG: potassium channel family protein [Gammaproteobacteria bacterium]|nr:potassium channel family protein [Gammaproteobacteria bacterium]
MTRLKNYCREFFYGTGEEGIRGRTIVLGLDIAIILYFVITTFLPPATWILVTDFIIGLILLTELSGRVLADSDKMGLLSRPLALLDLAIIVSLFAPTVFGNFSFLRIVRALRVLRSYSLTRRLKAQFRYFARNEEVIFSALNLLAFVFVVTAFVFVLQQNENESINNYVDALYFTVTTLTTTGFGDVILVGSQGKLLAIVIMIVGVALFLRLVQTIFRPSKVRYECPQCALTRHDLDAVHCKHCGHELHIRTEGIY